LGGPRNNQDSFFDSSSFEESFPEGYGSIKKRELKAIIVAETPMEI